MAEFSAAESAFMARALRLAQRGVHTAHPNPMVGCVLVNNGEIVGEGWHERAGEAHAEINALRVAGEKARGATAYLTLEPCSHAGKTPPCAPALIEAGITEVVIAMQDPFPAVSGNGKAALEAAGVRVRTGLMEAPAEALNAGFLSRVRRGRPFVRLKVASSLDGAIAMQSGESQWITGPEARDDVQRLRARSGAILTGIGTVLADDGPERSPRCARYPRPAARQGGAGLPTAHAAVGGDAGDARRDDRLLHGRCAAAAARRGRGPRRSCAANRGCSRCAAGAR